MPVLSCQHIHKDLTLPSRLAFPVVPNHLGHVCPGTSIVHRSVRRQRHVPPQRTAAARHKLSVQATSAISNSSCTSEQLGWDNGFFSKYTLGHMLGQGSFASVHVAVHNQTGHSYAVKVLQKTGHPGARLHHLDAIQREVSTWTLAQGSKFVARLEGLYEVS